MLSTIPGILVSDPIQGNPFPSLESENGFPEPLFLTSQSPKPGTSSGSGEPNPTNSKSGSDKPIMDERRKRRMISNRESARRSRMRKQKHLENLRNQATRLKVENRDISNRLRFVLYHCYGVKTENQRLRSEQSTLRQRLNNMQQILLFRQLQQFSRPCNNNNNNMINHNTTNNNYDNNLIASKDHFTVPPSLLAS